ncbi:3',5'-cyclic-AMP phosphodiesterase [Methylomarinum vadi]|uniref:3',5'-cyclic-AMP phosphodiesterase n=1 Tax=Methylomarinum vadi TaxID=438855 RepID=UPI000A5281B4|nr:3',5'-cyclic-AMP phosphodiesterase [Methylomarinum vadi]
MNKILQITDPHILPEADGTLLGIETEKYFRQALDHAHQRFSGFDLILLTGDLAQDPCPDSYLRVRQILNHYETPSICLPGNHDDFAQMQAIFNQGLVSCQRYHQLKNWQIICLNSQKPGFPGGLLNQGELNFLSEQLHRHSDLFTLIALHHHCIASGSSWMDTMMIENSEEFFACVANHPQIKAIICGHVHQVLEKERHGIQLLGTPASCFQFKPGCRQFALDDKPPGYRVIELDNDGSFQTQVAWLPIHLDELDFNSAGY